YIASFKNSLDEIQDHIKELEAICQKPISQKLYEMAKILNPKGYLLNSITLLFEAVGYYCAEKFQSFGNNIRDHIVKFEEIAKNNENKKFSAYQ
ncbi:hypothetical protein ACPF04_11670, partial [Campylobacter sp. MOP51]|uniref:hypothetical protein n=1 Tax=Campylobacter canis TaxID=3378588 RepID=UPI003C32E37C